MHPVFAMRDLPELELQIVREMAKPAGPRGLTQGEVARRLRPARAQPTVSRAMQRLIDAGILEKAGSRRNAAFSLTPEATWFATPPHLRPVVSYEPERIASYVPNKTFWLPIEAAERMKELGRGAAGPLDPSTYSRQIANRFLIDLSWASSVLEGNTYDYLDTEVLLQFGERAAGHDVLEAVMILNHKRAIDYILERVGEDVFEMNFVQRLHALLMRDLIEPDKLGTIRRDNVRIGASAYHPSGDYIQLRADLGSLLWKAGQIDDPAEACFFLLAGASYLQAFSDGNKRVGRLMCNVPLLAAGMPPLAFVGMDKANYLTGIIAFYERADATPLAEAILEGYEASAPSYRAAMAVQRVPRSVELRERDRIASLVRACVRSRLDPEAREAFLDDSLKDLAPPDREVISETVQEALEALTPENAIVWDVPEAEAEAWQQAQGAHDAEPGWEP
ncbi:Fic family protein [Amorphus sp. 3PC139-8]|uniref:Fic family protein n=1 Tax=Amorphus sp. 3PC139-8 TaxID=2735676 RepID=UPI00345CA7A0